MEAGLLGVQQGHERGVDHVLARRQHPAEVVDHLAGADVGVRGVTDAVGVEGEQGVDVLGGGDADRVDAAQLAGVAAGLVVAVDPEPGQLEVGVVDDGGHGVDADGPGRPLDDLVAHPATVLRRETTVDPARPQRGDRHGPHACAGGRGLGDVLAGARRLRQRGAGRQLRAGNALGIGLLGVSFAFGLTVRDRGVRPRPHLRRALQPGGDHRALDGQEVRRQDCSPTSPPRSSAPSWPRSPSGGSSRAARASRRSGNWLAANGFGSTGSPGGYTFGVGA